MITVTQNGITFKLNRPHKFTVLDILRRIKAVGFYRFGSHYYNKDTPLRKIIEVAYYIDDAINRKLDQLRGK